MLNIRITNDRQQESIELSDRSMEFGRAPSEDGQRFIIEDRYVSRQQMRITATGPRQVQIENFGATMTFADQTNLERGDSHSYALPLRLMVGYTTIEITSSVELPAHDSLQTIARPYFSARRSDESSLASLGESPSPAKLAQWFETLLSVQRAAAGSTEFYQQTAHAVVKVVGLDRGMVLMRDEADWRIVARHAAPAIVDAEYSHTVLGRVLRDRRTFFQSPEDSIDAAPSLIELEAVVASPIFDADEQIVGVVYGSRDLRNIGSRRGISALEAQVVQLLAGAATVGLARLEKEAEAVRVRNQFELFVPPPVARELARNPDLLAGQEREVTVMFSDVRGFTTISERLGPRDTYQLIGDAMDDMTNQIHEQAGIVVDYYGDGLVSMWNAPTDQDDHVRLACETALAIQAELPDLNSRWQARLGAPLRIGSGINTGPALVGNAGSRERVKYGPQGHTVNLASRVEGATKLLGVKVLITGAVKSLLGDDFFTRRLCRVRVLGATEAIDLHELAVASDVNDRWKRDRDRYEEALQLYETQQFAEAINRLVPLLDGPQGTLDTAAMQLKEQITAAMESPRRPFDSVFDLKQK